MDEPRRALRDVFAELGRLPEDEQEIWGAWLLDEISERRWARTLASSQDRLAELAGEADGEHRRGRTQELDPDRM